ncbi:hypothetical protein ACFQZX_17925 [Mucilaginibacter litoreus]|uniref:Uncharacterized protein n=1 Tax=Mucilaginibacter litoreus TaxID=1048221 RepID=A0ABW3AX80_9SPHI
MPNIKFSYLYRDASNYKNHSFIILNNPTSIPLVEAEKFIHRKLIDRVWLYADKWHMPDLHFNTWDSELDHPWHEFDSVELTNEIGEYDLMGFLRAIMD